MQIDEKTVIKIANLARIELNEQDVHKMQASLSSILSWIEQLDEVPTDDIEPLFNVTLDQMPMRQDIVNDGDQLQAVLSNAPATIYDMFTVPKVIE